jgi:hypothetical protein
MKKTRGHLATLFDILRPTALVSVGVLLMVSAVSAATFAQYEQTIVQELQIQYTDGDLSAVDPTTEQEGSNVLFDFDQLLLPGLQDISALLTINASSTGNAQAFGGAFSQPLSGSISFARTDGMGPANLLTVTFDSAQLIIGGASGSFLATDPGSNIVFTSSYLVFDPNSADGFSLALVDVAPPAGALNGSDLPNFGASASGRFNTEVGPSDVIPEPASMMLLGGGLSGLILLARRRRS